MATTNENRESRTVGVLLIVEVQGMQQVSVGRIRRSWQKQLDEAVEYFTGLILSRSHGLKQSYHGADIEPETCEEDIPFDMQRVYTAFLTRAQLHSIPIHAVGTGMIEDNKNGPGEYTIIVEDVAPTANDNFAIDEAHIRGLDLEVKELVRARRVTRIRPYRVVELVGVASASGQLITIQ